MSRTAFGAVCALGISLLGCSAEQGEPVDTYRQSLRVKDPLAQLLGAAKAPSPQKSPVARGRARLCQLQADILGDGARNGLEDADPDDGGWDFSLDSVVAEHSAGSSPTNTYGATALPLTLGKGHANASRRALGCALDAAAGMQTRPEVDSPPDFVQWVLLGQQMGNPGFAALAASRYDAKVAEQGSPQGLAEWVRDTRHSQGYDGLIGYDLAWLALAAQALDHALPDPGYADHATVYARVIGDDLTSATPWFDIEDDTQAFYATGLSWSLIALRSVSIQPRVQHRLRSHLLNLQLDSGAFSRNGESPAADLQATAHAATALALAPGWHSEGRRWHANRWLAQQQTADGGWDYAPDRENTLVNAEVLLALVLRKAPHAQSIDADPGDSKAMRSTRSLARSKNQEPLLAAPSEL